MDTAGDLVSYRHGKQSVRVAKVIRHKDGKHDFAEYTVDVELLGGSDESYKTGDNRNVVSTDTCKNHVYVLAKSHSFESPELFAGDLALFLLKTYPHLQSTLVSVKKYPWVRLSDDAGTPHNHGFARSASGRMSGKVGAVKVMGSRKPTLNIFSQLEGLELLKTTMSGWEDFHVSRFSTLQPTRDRMLATRACASWEYLTPSGDILKAIDFSAVHDRVQHALTHEFFGPSRSGTYSPGVQNTVYKLGQAVLKAVPEIRSITISLPNIHYLPCALPVYAKNGIEFDNDVYIPTDDPHGIIKATITRPRTKL